MPEAKTEVGDLDWRLPYRSMDAGGSPDAASVVAQEWISALATKERDAGTAATLIIEGAPLGSDGRVTALYRGTKLLAAATIFRDEMNFAVLVRWLADDVTTLTRLTQEADDHAEAASRWRARAGVLEEALRDLLPTNLGDNPRVSASPLGPEQLAAQLGVQPRGGNWNNGLAQLRRNGVAELHCGWWRLCKPLPGEA